MRLRNIPGAGDVIAASPYVIQNPKEHRGAYKELFGNDHALHVEIGMGKGKFIVQMAKLHPEINYIGMERYSSVLLRALQKLDAMEEVPCHRVPDQHRTGTQAVHHPLGMERGDIGATAGADDHITRNDWGLCETYTSRECDVDRRRKGLYPRGEW